MSKPLVAIIGKPNVGKSTFFNRVIGKRLAIVENIPGVTRDRIYADAEWCGREFTLIDTGGLELKSADSMWTEIKLQAEAAISAADVIVYFLDIKSGITANDLEIADKLRKSRKKIIVAVNKMDVYSPEKLADFYSLGLSEPLGISSEHGNGVADLLDEIVKNFDKTETEAESGRLKIAIVGKPNAGKSSLLNKLLGYKRTIVADVPGTTRDAIDTDFDFKDKKYTLIDTAGIRKKSSVSTDLEYYSVLRALNAVRRADVCLIVIDSGESITEQDVKICGYAHEQGKPSVIVMNKWDLIEKDSFTVNKFNQKLSAELAFMNYFKPIYISALTGLRVEKVLAAAEEVYENNSRRVTTSRLNDVIIDCVNSTEPPTVNGKRLKILYSSQPQANPPVFLIFVNDSSLVHFSYKRYIENSLRKAFNFEGTPIKVVFRNEE